MKYDELLTLTARFIGRTNDYEVVQLCGLSQGTSAGTLKTSRQITTYSGNSTYTLEAKDDIPVTLCVTQPEDTFCYYLVSLSPYGIVTTTKGANDNYAVPVVPLGHTKIGAFKIEAAIGSPFTAGSSAFDLPGITVTFYDQDAGIATSLINQAARKLERKHNFEFMQVRTSIALPAGTDTFTNPIPRFKELLPGGVYALDEAGTTKFNMERQDLSYLELYPQGDSGVPEKIGRVTTMEILGSGPDIVPTFNWMVRPIPDLNYTLVLTAYQYSPELDGIIYPTNWWTRFASDVLLYGSLVEMGAFAKDTKNLQIWTQMYQDSVKALLNAERRGKSGGSYPSLTSLYVS